ncbi:MAG: amino acid ABC transporter substrate-binding protein [Desulfobacteraceae bacterium]|nr:amino acid ABC transporter substrate-binding protein [Desulfobacteraceae bacterium]
MKKLFLLSFVMIMISIQSSAGQVIFVYESWPPYEYEDEQGKAVGKDTAIIREVCKRIKVEPVFKMRPWKRALHEVKKGKAHAIYSLFKTEERMEFLYYPSENMSAEKNVLFARKESNYKVKKLKDIEGKKIGTVPETSYGPLFDNYKKYTELDCMGAREQLQTLKAKRVDFVAIGEQVGKYYIKKLGYQGLFEIMEFPLSEQQPLFAGFSKALGEKNKLLADSFGTILKELKKEGFVQKIYEEPF